MIIVLDTSILINLEKGDIKTISKIRELSKIHTSPCLITFINYFEFLVGIRERNPKNKEKALAFIDKFGVIKVNKETAATLSELKCKHDKKGIILPLADLLIAAQIIENNMLLVTSDKDFENIEGLNRVYV